MGNPGTHAINTTSVEKPRKQQLQITKTQEMLIFLLWMLTKTMQPCEANIQLFQDICCFLAIENALRTETGRIRKATFDVTILGPLDEVIGTDLGTLSASGYHVLWFRFGIWPTLWWWQEKWKNCTGAPKLLVSFPCWIHFYDLFSCLALQLGLLFQQLFIGFLHLKERKTGKNQGKTDPELLNGGESQNAHSPEYIYTINIYIYTLGAGGSPGTPAPRGFIYMKLGWGWGGVGWGW